MSFHHEILSILERLKDLSLLMVIFGSLKICKITTSNIIFIKQYVLSGLTLCGID